MKDQFRDIGFSFFTIETRYTGHIFLARTKREVQNISLSGLTVTSHSRFIFYMGVSNPGSKILAMEEYLMDHFPLPPSLSSSSMVLEDGTFGI